MEDGEYIIRGKWAFYKENKNDKVWWVEEVDGDEDGEMLFSFDMKKIYNIFTDYPGKLTSKEKTIFDKENPYWAEFFKEKG